MATANTTMNPADVTAVAEVQATRPPSQLQQIIQRIAQLSQRQKIAGAAAIALAVALLATVLLWSKAPTYSVLFSNLEDRDGGAIVTVLQQQNIPYKISDNGRAILIPKERVNDVRLNLASQGLPRGGNIGFELMETQKLGVSQFLEQVNFQRALEGELSRTIQGLSSVISARVHLAIPKQSGFLRDDKKSTASVMLTLYPGRRLDTSQVAGIVHLVASSVPHMSYEGVSIVDQNGNLLTERPDLFGNGQLDATKLHYVQEVESAYVKRIDAILTPMVGSRNFTAQVAADIDFNQVEQTAETYRPNPSPDQAIRSQQTMEEINRTGGPQGVPGALTNQPPVPATAPITNPPVDNNQTAGDNPFRSSRTATINYELDRNIQHTRQALGQVRRLSVAVVINNKTEVGPNGQPRTVSWTEEEINRITSLVREAMGYNAGRGDSISVSNAPFAEPVGADNDITWWKDPQIIALAETALKAFAVIMALAFIYFAIVRPLIRTVMGPEAQDEKSAKTEAEEASEDEDYTINLSETAEMTLEQKITWAKGLAHQNPKIIANLVKDWLNGQEGQ